MTNSHTMFICSFVQKETTLCSQRKLALPPTSVHWLRVPVGQFGRLTNIFPSLCRADQSQTALTRFLRPELDYCAHNTSGIFVGSRWQDSGLRFIVVKYSVKKKKKPTKTRRRYLILNCMKLLPPCQVGWSRCRSKPLLCQPEMYLGDNLTWKHPPVHKNKDTSCSYVLCIYASGQHDSLYLLLKRAFPSKGLWLTWSAWIPPAAMARAAVVPKPTCWKTHRS